MMLAKEEDLTSCSSGYVTKIFAAAGAVLQTAPFSLASAICFKVFHPTPND
jgi:hypothetical protein